MTRSKLTCIVLLLTGIPLLAAALDDFEYVFPQPDAIMVPCQSQIMFRLKEISPQNLANLEQALDIQGSSSGTIDGSARLASDGRTVIFKPDAPFMTNETIHVRFSLKSRNGTFQTNLNYSFHTTSTADGTRITVSNAELDGRHQPQRLSKPQASMARIMPNGVSVPGDFPFVNVLTNTNPAPGYIFIVNRDTEPKYNMILENDGSPIWYMKTPDNRRDFKVQDNGNLSMLVRSGYPFGTGYIELDHTYAVIDSFDATNGYSSDEHGIQILENGHYLLMGRREDHNVDMSQYVPGGRKDATVRETCIQEFTPEHELIFQWRAWDYFDIADTYVPGENELTGGYIRFPHMNAVDIDSDGHILLSSRHLSEVTKIHRQTGEIIWRLSGPKNQFQFIDDPLNGFENQHDIRNIAPNRYTVFDNGNEHTPPVTRAVEYELDPEAKTARLVWQYDNSDDHYSHYMGNAQRLPGGNTFINWAASRSDRLSQLISEVTPDGEAVYRLEFQRKSDCYRSFRFPWQGVATAPNLFVEPQFDNITLGFNVFGDADVEYYKIYGGTRRNPTTVLDTSRTTLKSFRNLENGQRYYFRVTAVRTDGSESEFSNQENVVVNIASPGDNMMFNGDFSRGKERWMWQLNDPAEANFRLKDGAAHIEIENGGNDIFDVHIRQNGYPLINGRTYVFEFDAWADNTRIIEAKVAQDEGPWINYSKIGYTALSRRERRYSYEFVMEDATDSNARVVFNCGTDANDVYIDNVVLKMKSHTPVEASETGPHTFHLYENYPNPFNATTTIRFDLDQRQQVQLLLFNVRGQQVRTLLDSELSAGPHRISFNASDLPSGVYIYHLKTPSQQQSRKMLYIR